MSIYHDVSTFATRHGEEGFPFMSFKEDRDWDAIYEEWVRICKYCKRHGYIWKQEEEEEG